MRRLGARFFLASCLLVLTTVASALVSALTFARLSGVTGDTLRESRETIDLAATLSGALEREDDALISALTGDADRARQDLPAQRQAFERAYDRLREVVSNVEEREAAASLRRNADAYRAAGDELIRGLSSRGSDRDGARAGSASERYHRYVNPILREADADCARLRELNFQSMQLAAVRAHDEEERSTRIVTLVSLAALVISVLVSAHLARSIVQPIEEMTASVEAFRKGEFERRIAVTGRDEIARLAEGFNRMAESLARFRRLNVEEVVRAKEALEATLEALPDAVIVVGPDERVESLNAPARAYLGASGRGESSRLADLLLPREALEATRRALRGERAEEPRDLRRAVTVRLGPSPDVSGEGARAPSGPEDVGERHRQRRLLPIAVPLKKGAVAILYDVTEFARLDELRAELIGVASHELKTPLTTLRMNLMLLAESKEALEPRQREIVATAALGCEQLADTVDELLDITRIEAGQLRLDLERFPVRLCLERAAKALTPQLEDAGIHLLLDNEDGEAMLKADPKRLGVVLGNLLGNALKYTPRGGQVSVTSRRIAGPEAGPLLQIAVTDSGPGVEPEFRERVFEKFFRVEHERPEAGSGARGAGIGLYLCREIIAAHGGMIRCEANPAGPGARFVITLPAE